MTERNRLQPIEEWTAPVADFQDDEISAKAIAAQYVAMFGEKKTQLEPSETDDDLFNHPSAIPVANRLRFLVDSNYDIEHFSLDEFLELDEVAAGLGTNEEELGNLVREMGVSDQFAPLDEFQNTVLAPGMDVVLAEELKWQAQYEAFEDFITIPALANYFNASYEIVRKVLRRADISPMVAKMATITTQKKRPSGFVRRLCCFHRLVITKTCIKSWGSWAAPRHGSSVT